MSNVLGPLANKTIWLGDGMKCGIGLGPSLEKEFTGRKGFSLVGREFLGPKLHEHSSASLDDKSKHSPLLT